MHAVSSFLPKRLPQGLCCISPWCQQAYPLSKSSIFQTLPWNFHACANSTNLNTIFHWACALQVPQIPNNAALALGGATSSLQPYFKYKIFSKINLRLLWGQILAADTEVWKVTTISLWTTQYHPTPRQAFIRNFFLSAYSQAYCTTQSIKCFAEPINHMKGLQRDRVNDWVLANFSWSILQFLSLRV